MAHIQRTVSWAAHLMAALIAFLFSAAHLTPPSWARVPGIADTPSHTISDPELTSLIGELSQSERFDDRLRKELDLLHGTKSASSHKDQPIDSLLGVPLPQPQPQQSPVKDPQPQQAYISKEPPDWMQPQQAYISKEPPDWTRPQQAYIATAQPQGTAGQAAPGIAGPAAPKGRR